MKEQSKGQEFEGKTQINLECVFFDVLDDAAIVLFFAAVSSVSSDEDSLAIRRLATLIVRSNAKVIGRASL
jgi:hypothetical protein